MTPQDTIVHLTRMRDELQAKITASDNHHKMAPRLSQDQRQTLLTRIQAFYNAIVAVSIMECRGVHPVPIEKAPEPEDPEAEQDSGMCSWWPEGCDCESICHVERNHAPDGQLCWCGEYHPTDKEIGIPD